MPDLVMYVDVSPEVAKTRGSYGEERYEVPEFQRRVGARFRELAAEMAVVAPTSWQTIDGAGTMDEVAARVREAFEAAAAAAATAPIRRLWDGAPLEVPPAAVAAVAAAPAPAPAAGSTAEVAAAGPRA